MPEQDLDSLVRGIVAAQGNLYIRELLRDKGLAVGGTKEDFIARLRGAVVDGSLTLADIETWLHGVEGWGNFHIYPFEVPAPLASDSRWTADRVRQTLNVGDAQWEAGTSQVFPSELTLSHVSFHDGTLRLLWHQGSTWRQRAKQRDRREEIDGDVYEFDAHLIRAQRSVVRFQLSTGDKLGAVFVPYPQNDENHRSATVDAWDSVSPLVARDELPAFDIATIIAAADKKQLDGPGALRSKSARLTVGDGYIEFGSMIDAPYGEIDALREVRLAAGSGDFAGGRATFFYVPPDDPGRRRVTITLTGQDSRIWMPAQLDESQVWALLASLGGFAS